MKRVVAEVGSHCLTIHICFLRETVFVGTNHPNMEETGSLENPIPSGKCYLDLSRADYLTSQGLADGRCVRLFHYRFYPDVHGIEFWEMPLQTNRSEPARSLSENSPLADVSPC